MHIFRTLRRRSWGVLALAGLSTLGLAACDEDDDNDLTVAPTDPSIAELASGTPELSTLVSALSAAGLVDALQNDGPFTVFAPVNSAFDALPAGTLDALLDDGNGAILADLLTFHVVPGTFTAGQLTQGAQLHTLAGGDLRISLAGGGVQVNGRNVVSADIAAGNGVVHLIDGVIVDGLNAADRAAITPDLSTLAAAVGATGLGDALNGEGPFTVFAPINSAFEGVDLDVALDPANRDLLAEILTYHVVPGVYEASELREGQVLPTLENSLVRIGLDGGATINGVDIVATDIKVGNGVVHLIDGVLLESATIAQRAALTPGTSTLSAALAAAGLTDALNQTGPFTVFAPVNDAFDGLPLETLLDPANLGLLQDILTYHVVPGDIRAGDLRDGQTVTTLEGNTLEIDLTGGAAVNGVDIIATDIETENGVIHLIDGVLLESLDIVQRASITPQTSTLVAAVAAGQLVETLQGEGPFTVFAPVNDAFEGLPLETLLDPANLGLLQDILTYHVIPGEVRAADLVDGAMPTTVEGGTVTIDLDGGPKVNGANITLTDIETENGVIHLIDGVLLESLDIVQRASITPQTATLVDAVVAGGLVETLQGDGPFTVFAPTSDAFAAIPDAVLGRLLDPANLPILQKVLTYHVIAGEVREADLVDGAMPATVEGSTVTIDLDGGAKVNGANIIATDIETENGVIHLIDQVLLENLDIVDQAILNGFGTLVGAVQTAGLEATLRTDNGGAGFTVFAPTDAAFAALAAIPTDPAVLADILLYHVVGGTVGSGDLSDGLVVPTLQGGTFTVNFVDGGVQLEGANNTVTVTLTDVPASNGVIHVIDAVLLP